MSDELPPLLLVRYLGLKVFSIVCSTKEGSSAMQ